MPAFRRPIGHLVAATLGLAASLAFAQASAPGFVDLKGRSDARPPATPPPHPPASAPSPKLRPLDQTGAATAPVGAIQQERSVVVPQVTLPVGRTPPPPTATEARRVDARRPAMRGGIDDAAARCEGEANAQARAACRARVPSTPVPTGAPR